MKVQIEKLGRLPENVSESSGLAYFGPDRIYSHGDSGNEPVLYQFAIEGDGVNFVKNIPLPSLQNNDWEDITRDPIGNLYIGDFGNNKNSRQNLSVYVLDTALQLVNTIKYNYPDQNEFPPDDKENWNYDCEAFFWLNDKLYFFSKNMKWHYTRIYEMDLLNNNQINLIDSLFLKSPITAADVRSDGSEAVLLTYGKIFFINIQSGDGPPSFSYSYCKKIRNSGQAEGITYISDDEVLITNEKGKVYLVKRRFSGG